MLAAYWRAATAPGEKNRVVFIDMLRAVAALCVVYMHLQWIYLRGRDLHIGLFHWLDTWVVRPTGLAETTARLGGPAVVVFFLISGFVVTPIAIRMGSARFAINRFFRVYPLYVFALGVAIAVVLVGGLPLVTGDPEPVTGTKIVNNLFLVNFAVRPLDAYLGVAWTLAVEVISYALVVLLARLFRRSVVLAILVELNFVVLAYLLFRWLGSDFGGFAALSCYLLVIIIGQVFWAAKDGRITKRVAFCLTAVAWLLFVWGARAKFEEPEYMIRAIPVAIAILLFLAGLAAERYLRQRPFWTALSERTYALYLMHGLVLFPVLELLRAQMPLWPAVLLSLLSMAVAVELSYRFVERPLHQLGRKLSRRGRTLKNRRADASARPVH